MCPSPSAICRGMALALVVLLAGCGTNPAEEPAAGGAADKNKVRIRSQATVYIYRQPGGMPGAYPKTILVDGKPIGLLVDRGYFMVKLDPGHHVISTPAANKAEVALHVTRGASYYVSQEIIPAHPPYVLLNRVKEAVGRPYVAHGKRLYK